MFEHLDDPAQEVNPGARELAIVSRRAQQIRTRHRWTLMVGFCCVLLAASVGFFLAGPSVRQPSTSTADYQFNLLKGKVPVGVSVPTTALLNVGFADPQDGFALAAHRGDVLLAASTDGGTTWQVRNDDLPSGLGADDGYPGQFEFVGSTGYLWGARTTGAAPLWVSHDDGATWQLAQIGPSVLDVSAIGTNVWALTSECPATATAAGAGGTTFCAVGVEQSVDGGNTWRSLHAPALTGGLPGGYGLHGVELARITTTRAYMLTSAQTGPTAVPGWQLSFTADSGVIWTSRVVPCRWSLRPRSRSRRLEHRGSVVAVWQPGHGGFAIQAALPVQRWRAVVVVGGVGHWARHAAAGRPFRPTRCHWRGTSHPSRSVTTISRSPPPRRPGSSPRGALYVTSDGGSSWAAVPELAAAGFAGGGQGNITFLSPTDGWICAYGIGLWQTTDGTHWHPLGIG